MALLKMGVIGTSKKRMKDVSPFIQIIYKDFQKTFADSSFLRKDMANLSILKMMKSPGKQEE